MNRGLLYLIAAWALLPFMITGDSIWIDEGTAAKFAMQPDFPHWLDALAHEGGSDSQMLLGDFFAWVGGRVIGVGEWQLRVINLLWGGLTLLIAASIGRRLQIPWLPLFFTLQPFFWYYTNEARPYASQITFGAMILLSLVQFVQAKGQGLVWVVTLTAGSVLLCFATMLAPVQIAVTVAAGGIIAGRNGWKIERRAPLIVLSGLLLLLPLGYYYLTTLVRGAKGAQLWNVDFRYLVFIPYEISGSLGLGPSLDHLREFALKGLWSSIPEIAFQCATAFSLLTVVLVVILYGVWNRRRDENPFLLIILIPFLLEVTILFIVGILIHKAFWPRHYSAAFPCYVTALALALKPLLAGQKIGRIISVSLLGLLLAAVIGIRFGAEHQKEDYRWAAKEALHFSEEGQNVWWCAGGDAATYYGIIFDRKSPEGGGIFLMHNWEGASPSHTGTIPSDLPDEIIMSRPDVHDGNGTVRKLIQEKNYQRMASRGSFELWLRQLPMRSE